MNWLCLLLDRLFFPSLPEVVIKKPVFVVGVPRSGTTYLHRALAKDEAFTTASTWEVALAPSVLQRRLVKLIAAIDDQLGRPLRRLLAWIVRDGAASMTDVHAIGLEDAEEDYLLLLSAAGCFFASLAFPANRRFRSLAHIADLPKNERDTLLDQYHSLLQRQCFDTPARQFLSKNAAFASWVPYLAERYPDALFIVCVRDPTDALDSQLNSLASARRLFASFPDETVFRHDFKAHYLRWFEDLSRACRDSTIRSIVVEQEWMRDHPHALMDLLYSHLERPVPQAARTHREPSAHGEPSANRKPSTNRQSSMPGKNQTSLEQVTSDPKTSSAYDELRQLALFYRAEDARALHA